MKTDEPIKKVAPQKHKSELLVKFKPGTTPQAIQNIAQRENLEIIKIVSSPDLYLMKASPDADLKKKISDLKKHAEIEYSEPNHVRELKN